MVKYLYILPSFRKYTVLLKSYYNYNTSIKITYNVVSKHLVIEDFSLCCTCLQHLWHPEDDSVLQPKHVRAIKPVVQLVGNKLVCIQHVACSSHSLKTSGIV